VPMVHGGILRIFCVSARGGACVCVLHEGGSGVGSFLTVLSSVARQFTIANIKAGEQIFVNYGSAYWKATGVTPVDF